MGPAHHRLRNGSTTIELDWPGCRNARDLGGLDTSEGRRIRPGALLRSDNLDRLTARGIETVRAAGVSRILDLRWGWEARKYPSPFAGDPVYRNVPLLAEDDSDSYGLLLDLSPGSFAAAFTAVADAPAGAVLVHCHAGKDRAGLLVAFALLVAGVPAGAVADDYARSEGCARETMLETIEHVRQAYGDAEGYLLGGGVTPRRLRAVRERLLG